MNNAETEAGLHRIVLVTGPSGAGRSLAIAALEDLGFEAIDNLPISLVPRLLEAPAGARPLALGIDTRNRDFSVAALIELMDRLNRHPAVIAETLYLDCSAGELLRRFAQTRRPHPLSPGAPPEEGIALERALLQPIRDRAEHLIDTTELAPHELRATIAARFGQERGGMMAVAVSSFSFRRGLPRGADLVFDVRFLKNPHWHPALRGRDGRDLEVAAFIEADPRFAPFFERLTALVLPLLAAFREEGKASVSIAIGCTGGRHRSVAVAERLAAVLAEHGWTVAKRHRELERDSHRLETIDFG